MPRILRNLRIDEVSFVDKGAGAGCRIVISKRDDSADGDDVYQTDWYRREAAEAERQNREHLRNAGLDREKRGEGRFLKYFLRNKSFAADARGDEADQQDEKAPPPVDDVLAAGVDGPSAIAFETADHRYTFRNERALATWLAVQERIHKSHQEEPSMTKEQLEAERTAKLRAVNPIEISKVLAAENSARGISESELVSMISNFDRRDGETEAQTFTRHYMAQEEVRKAVAICKAAEATLEPIVVDGNVSNPDDAAAATAALGRVVEEQRRRFPWMSAEQAYDAAMRERPDLAARAIPQLAPTSIYPMPR